VGKRSNVALRSEPLVDIEPVPQRGRKRDFAVVIAAIDPEALLQTESSTSTVQKRAKTSRASNGSDELGHPGFKKIIRIVFLIKIS
jgi:hypothetical protein